MLTPASHQPRKSFGKKLNIDQRMRNNFFNGSK
jgi:hypothetical protein